MAPIFTVNRGSDHLKIQELDFLKLADEIPNCTREIGIPSQEAIQLGYGAWPCYRYVLRDYSNQRSEEKEVSSLRQDLTGDGEGHDAAARAFQAGLLSLRRRVSVTVLLGVITAVAVGAIVVGLTVAPPVMAAGGALMSYVPVGSVGLFVSSLWQKSRSLLKRQRDAVDSMQRGTSVALNEMARISVLASQPEDLMKSMGETAMTAQRRGCH